MKNSNSGLIGAINDRTSSAKSGVYGVEDVYEGRFEDGSRVGIRSNYSELTKWVGAESDPYYDSVRIHVREPQGTTHLMRDSSTNGWDRYLLLDSTSRCAAPTFFGPRYQHFTSQFGDNGYIKLNENNSQFQFGTNPFTIEFWFKRQRNDNTDHFIMGQGNTAGITGGTGWAIYINASNKFAFVNASASTTVTSSATILVDEWYHVACVRENINTNGFKIYINGFLDVTGTCANFHPTNSTSLYIGRDRVATQATYFGGLMTDLRIVANSAVYSNSFQRPTQPLDMTLPGIRYHDSVTNPRFYTDCANSPNNVPVTLESSQIVKIVDGPNFVENTKTEQQHGSHSAYLWSRQNQHKYLDAEPTNTSLRFGTGPFTVEAWVYMNERATNNGICGKGTSVNGWNFWIDNSQRLRFTANAVELFNSGTVTSNYVGYGGWNHVAAVRDSTSVNAFRLYVNGRLEYTGTDVANYSTRDPLYVFSDRTGSTQFNGFVCGVRISKSSRYTANFSVGSSTFIDSSMSVDPDVSFLTATCGTQKLMPTQDWYIDYGKERVPQVRRGSELRLGPHHPTSNTGFCIGGTDGASRIYMRSNAKVVSWTRIGTDTWSACDSGLRHSAAVRSDGTLWTWGDNGWGQLGLGDQMSRSVPTQVGTDTNWKQVSCGWASTYAVKTTGTLWSWGYNNYNQLGDGSSATRLLPRQIGTDTNWDQVWASHKWDGAWALARKTNSTLWGWGWNGWYGIGDGTGDQRSAPTQVAGAVTTWTKLFVSSRGHSFGIRSDNSLWVWGRNDNYQFGTGNNSWSASPVQTGTGSSWLWAAGGNDHSIAIKTDGTLWGVGWGGYGQVGDNTGIHRTSGWTQIGTANNWAKCWAGWYCSYAVKTDGTLWAWGFGVSGQLGDGKQTQYWLPVQVSSLNFNHTYPYRGNEMSMLMITSTGHLYTCGTNKMYQLGLNNDSAFNWGTQDFSFEFWYRRQYDLDNMASNSLYNYFLFDARSYYIDRVDGDRSEWCIKNNHNTNNIEIYVNGISEMNNNSGYAPASLGQWIHYCWQRVNGVMALYANGRKVDEKFYPHKISAHGNQVTIGSGSSPYLHYTTGLNGLLSDIRVNLGSAAYAVGSGNPDTIPVPVEPLKTITGTVFRTACGPTHWDYSNTTAYYNEVRADGNTDEGDYYRDRWDLYLWSHGPYVRNLSDRLDHNNYATGKILPYGDTWDGTNMSEGHSYWMTPANQYPEYAWITRMVKPWTIEFWFWGHQSQHYYNSVAQHRKLYTATSASHNGWEIYYGQRETGTGTNINGTWGNLLFRLWTANDSAQQIFSADDTSTYRAHGWNHCAVVFSPSGTTNKMAIFMNGKRVGARVTQLTGSTRVYNTYYLYNDATGIGGIRISDSVRYSPDATTYTVPFDGYAFDNNTVSLINAEGPNLEINLQVGQLNYGLIPNYSHKKFGSGSFRFQTLDQTNSVVARMYFAENSWRYYNLDMRMRDITMECWCTWWDMGYNSMSFSGSQGFTLPSSGTLNPTNGSFEFWIKPAVTQIANPIIVQGSGATASRIGINGSGQITFTIRADTATAIVSKTVVTDNKWHHVVCVKYEQSATRADGFLYVDGKLEAKSVGWVGSFAWNISTGSIGINYTGLMCNFHFTSYREKYMSSWDRLGSALFQSYASNTFNPIPVTYSNVAISETATTGNTATNRDFESGKYQIPQAPLSSGNNTILLLNVESTADGVQKDTSENNFTLTASGSFPTVSTDTPFYRGGGYESFPARPKRRHESGFGSTIFNHSGGPHVWRTEEGYWAFSISSDFMYDITYPRRLITVRSNIRVRNMSESDGGWQHVCLQRSNYDWILWIDGVEAGRVPGSNTWSYDRPIYMDNHGGDYSSSYVYLGSHSSGSWWRSWTGCVQDFRVSSMARYDSKYINGKNTMVHRGTSIPALPTAFHPIGS